MANKDLLNQKTGCDMCNVFCSSVCDLLNHVLGYEHRINLGCVSPECLSFIDRLQYILDTYMKLEAFVGLEYIEERKEGNTYRYQCLLCSYQGQMKQIFQHINGSHHITTYLKKHHPDLCVRSHGYSKRNKLTRALRRLSSSVCKTYGRKTIIEVNADGSRGPTPQKVSDSSSDPKIESSVTPDINEDSQSCSLQHPEQKSNVTPDINGDSQSCSLQHPEQKGNVTPDINGDPQSCSLQHPEQKGSDHPVEVSEFTENGEFFDFLQKFEIRSEDDVWVIKQITQNCTQALVRFREEEAQQNQVPGDPTAPANESGKDSSVSATDAGKVAPAPELQTSGLELFFNSIRNMEGSEVGGVLQEVVDTNPAFRGIDVANVIKYLRATRRLKTS